jgi:hypothetical protein
LSVSAYFERDLAKVDVVSSNLIARSSLFPEILYLVRRIWRGRVLRSSDPYKLKALREEIRLPGTPEVS